MTSPRKILPAFVTMVMLTRATYVLADEAGDLEKGTSSYDAGRYEEGAERLRQMLDSERVNGLKEPRNIERARAYLAACLVALGRLEEAKREIDRIYRQNPVYIPDPVIFPGRVIDLFADERQRLKEEILKAERAKAEQEKENRLKQEQAREKQQEYLNTLRQLAADESIVVRHSRWIAAVPFGMGQFQNGDTGLAYAFLVSELLALGTSVGSMGVLLTLSTDASNHLVSPETGRDVDWTDLNQRLRTAQAINIYSTAAFVGLALGGVLHAQLTFVPEVREHRTRPLPTPPVVPNVSLMDSKFVFGLQGRF
jgi:tetratricopeptide (TPR) repeat protein